MISGYFVDKAIKRKIHKIIYWYYSPQKIKKFTSTIIRWGSIYRRIFRGSRGVMESVAMCDEIDQEAPPDPAEQSDVSFFNHQVQPYTLSLLFHLYTFFFSDLPLIFIYIKIVNCKFL